MENSGQPSATLNNGLKMPLIGLGTYDSKDEKSFTQMIRDSLDIGYRHIDTASFYENHKLIGSALKTIFSQGKYKREDIFITTKYFPLPHLDAYVLLKNFLVELQTDYVDQYLIHWPSVGVSLDTNEVRQKPHHISWPELEKCYDEQLAKSIGVSNFNCQSLLNLLSFAQIKPAVNQIEFNTYYQPWNLVKFCQRVGIVVVGYSPLAKGGAETSYEFSHKKDLFNESVLKEISAAHKATVAQVVLKFISQNGIVVIPKSIRKQRLQQNFDSLKVSDLSKQEIEKIQTLNIMKKLVDAAFIPAFGNTPFFD